jgi:hypothetical protein
VDYAESQASYLAGERGTLEAWRRTGRFFASPGAGALIPVVAARGALNVELRLLLLFPSLGAGAALGAGYVHDL